MESQPSKSELLISYHKAIAVVSRSALEMIWSGQAIAFPFTSLSFRITGVAISVATTGSHPFSAFMLPSRGSIEAPLLLKNLTFFYGVSLLFHGKVFPSWDVSEDHAEQNSYHFSFRCSSARRFSLVWSNAQSGFGSAHEVRGSD